MADSVVTSELKPPTRASSTSIRQLHSRSAVTWRSLSLGVVGVLFICVLTPFNDYVLKNTSLVGSALPIGLLLFFLLFITLLNAAFHKWLPFFAMDASELATAVGMTMVSCAIPGSAFLKYTPAHLVGIWEQAAANDSFRQVLDTAHLPTWMFPSMKAYDALGRAQDPVVHDYIGRATTLHNTFIEHIEAVPWAAWRTPAITWGILFACMSGMAICIACLVHRQWTDVERLSFPLATLYASLIEPPAPGRALNSLFRSPLFWTAFGTVFAIHGINSLNVYYPALWPKIPIDYDVRDIFTEAPWKYVDPNLLKATISFTVIGLTYFVQQRIAFSVWFCMVALTVPRMLTNYEGTDWPGGGFYDQVTGALIPYALMILWTGRHEWATVIRRMFGKERPHDSQGRYLPFPIAGWGLTLCTAGMSIWLLAAGAGWLSTSMLVFFVLSLMLVLMRIVAETGIVAIQFLIAINRPWRYLLMLRPSLAETDSIIKPYFLAAFFNVLFTVPQREPMAVFVSQTLRTHDLTRGNRECSRRGGIAIIGSLLAALVIGYTTSGASLLFYEYKYATTLDKSAETPINKYGVGESATYALNETADLQQTRRPREDSVSSAEHLAIGVGVSSFLAIMQLRFAWWPIHPLGYLLTFSWPTWVIWWSVFLGWLAKSIILRLGGSKLFRAAKPFFIGLILGECGAAGFWLAISLIRLAMGLDYHAINVLPFL
jgi:hypothetical protein